LDENELDPTTERGRVLDHAAVCSLTGLSQVRGRGLATWGIKNFKAEANLIDERTRTEKKPGKTYCSVASDFSSTHDGERSWTDHARQRRIEVGLFFFSLPGPSGLLLLAINRRLSVASQQALPVDGWMADLQKRLVKGGEGGVGERLCGSSLALSL
jgi:hypothetical protein